MHNIKKIILLERAIYILIIALALFFIFSLIIKTVNISKVQKKFLHLEESISLGMLNPSFQNFVETNPIKIKALKSLNKTKDEMEFFDISGEVIDNKNRKIEYLAEKGIYNSITQELALEVGAKIHAKNDFDLNAEKITYISNLAQINGSNDIRFSNEMGDFKANEFKFFLKDEKYYFYKDIEFVTKTNKNAIVSAQFVEVDDFHRKIKITKKPQYKNSDIILTAKEFFIQYVPETENEASYIRDIEVKENVRLKHLDYVITGEIGYFYPKRNIVEIKKNVKVVKQGSTITGEELVYDINTAQFKMLQKDGKVKIRLDEDFGE